MSSHDDDEFDDLFSFSVASPTPVNTNTSTSSTTTASTNNATTTTTAATAANATAAAAAVTTTTDNIHPQPLLASTELESSYCKIDNDINDDDDDDIFGDFNLESIQSKHLNMTKEEDFNGMDEGTREFLDFLENDTTITTGTGTGTSNTVTALMDTNDVIKDIFGDNEDTSTPNEATKNILASLEDDSSSSSSDKDDNDMKGMMETSRPTCIPTIHRDEQEEEDMTGFGFVTVNANNNEHESKFATSTTHNDSRNDFNVSKSELNAEVKMDANNNDQEIDTCTLQIETIDLTSSQNSSTNDNDSRIHTKTVTMDESNNKNSSSSTIKDDTNVFTDATPPSKQIPTLNANLSNTSISPVKLPTLPTNLNRQSSTASSTSIPMQSKSILTSVESTESESDTDTGIDIFQLNVVSSNNQNIHNTTATLTTPTAAKMKEEDNQEQDTIYKTTLQEEIKEVTFDSLLDALQSSESKLHHIRSFIYNKRNHSHSFTTTTTSTTNTNPSFITSISKEDRPYLWSKVICGKVLNDVQSSSLVDSFVSWNECEFDYDKFVSKEDLYDIEDEGFIKKILNEVHVLASRIVHGVSAGGGGGREGTEEDSKFQLGDDDDDDDDGKDDYILKKAKRDLCSLLVFYYRSTSNIGKKKMNSFASILKRDGEKKDTDQKEVDTKSNNQEEGDTTSQNKNQSLTTGKQIDEKDESVNKNMEEETETSSTQKQTIEWNSFIGPIATALLAASIPIQVASVMLSKIISTLPLISLTKFERLTAVKSLHQQFYFLVCYHLPLLVLHLDKYAPGWHWPLVMSASDDHNNDESNSPTRKSRNLQANGTVPMTWFVSLLAGEGTNVTLDQAKLLPLWDVLLTCDDQSLKFFLALALLEKHSDSLMMLRGQELIDELLAVMSLKPSSNVEDETFLGHQNISSSHDNDATFVLNWYYDAKILQDSTPSSVMLNLRKAEDKAVDHILTVRSKVAMEKMKERLEAEAEAHRKAVEEENMRKAEERLYNYYKKRLESFYDKHCPEKKASVDKILVCYKDRYPLLDQKLQDKYGSGFLPFVAILNPQIANQTNKFISNVGQGIESRKKNLVASRAKERAAKLDEDMMGPNAHQVAIKVSASEVMPVVCGSKTGIGTREPLKYYLVDSRPKETVKIQGGFPTAVHLCPEDLMDPDCMQEKVDMFESLRGAVHICIMVSNWMEAAPFLMHVLFTNDSILLV